MIVFLHECPGSDPDKPVLVPGEPEAKARAEAETRGLTYDPATGQALCKLAAELGLQAA
jgi:LDH2 family malate/lactate/ureidoglycolate dehydrogenase